MYDNNYDLLVGGDILIAKPISDFAAADNLGGFASMKNTDKLYVLILLAAGTDTQNAILELQQATDAAGTGVKALNITDLHYKSGANLAAINTWTRVTTITRQASVASYNAVGAGVASHQQAFVIRIHEDDLDVNNGFTHVRFKIADTGATARNGSAIYIAPAMGYQGKVKPSLAT
jgi:hypothetical protein